MVPELRRTDFGRAVEESLMDPGATLVPRGRGFRGREGARLNLRHSAGESFR